jgi:zinc transporter, ZIP family
MDGLWLNALFWGLVAGSALILGSVMGYYLKIPARLVAAVMGFGAGVLISVLAFSLMGEAYRHGGFAYTAVGFLAGASIFTAANLYLSRRGAKHRKRSGGKQPSESDKPGSGLAIAVGSLLDDIPESVAIGLSLLTGGTISIVVVIGIFLSNIPEALSSSAGMKKSGRPAGYVFGVWGITALACGAASLLGYVAFGSLPEETVSVTLAVAAGAILAMLADTMLPEAFEEAHDLSGVIVVVGFLIAFILGKWAG